MSIMKVCFFGSYVKDSWGIPSGNGGVLLKKILEHQNFEVIECHESLEKKKLILPIYVKLFLKHIRLDYDILLIPWRGILTLPLAKLIHKKPIIFFPAFSIYDTLVNDRKIIKKKSIKAKFIHFIDKIACKWSDIVILESTEEINYFVKEFGIAKEKFRQCPLAADESIFFPKPNEIIKKKFVVLFFGSFIPLHGIKTIVKSCIFLKKYNDVIFKICGKGQTKAEAEKIINDYEIKNVEFLGVVPKDVLLENIHSSDVCLGIFGDTLKAKKVVTNKVFQILGSKKPLITRESPAVIENHLVNMKNCLLVPPNNPEKLAEAILYLKNNPKISQELAEEGYRTYCKYLSIDVVGKKLANIIQELTRNKV